ncbi:hypothetical protein B0H14DRAFT_3101092 [Mycena olivaceomarginata]|nr:hypothetical protein B0H14DRAFT_3101092 [Mycena olivaceomarginata]
MDVPNVFFRCGECGVFLQCRDCCVQRHRTIPLHFLDEWNGEFWKRTTLKDIGLVYQLGHEGMKCNVPHPLVHSLTVLHTTGIHEIHYQFCGCDRSDTANGLAQLLWNAWYPASFTDPDTCATFADRYKTFGRMARQYSFVQRLRRAGRGHDPAGIEATRPGECMVVCWACPYNGRNLPANWRDVDPKYRFLFRLILAMDANFKMKNRIRAREHNDPSLGPGWGAFVEPTKYKKHLRNYVAEKDISTCIAFAALTQKDTRNTAGLRVSGVGGCVCTRHECMRPNGLGDLQKGERYTNMDYILMSALADFDLQEVTLSYDIACQWIKNFEERMEHLPEHLRRDLDAFELQTGLPVWHALAHEDSCASMNSLNYLLSVGHSDGEGVERLWAWLNGFAYQSKEMGLGNRADSLEDKLDSHNFLKNLGEADSLRRKLIVAIAERARQVAAFKEINKSIPSETRAEWQQQIDAFTTDHAAPNPYMLANQKGATEAEIRASLKREEQEAAKKGQAPLHATSATAFLAAGLQLEETQRPRSMNTRLAFTAKLRKFRELQAVYMPAAVRMIQKEEVTRDPDLPAPSAEHIRLWLPSELPRNIVDMEAKLREGQAENALVTIRGQLHSKCFLINFRNKNLTGQKKTTRAHTILSQLGDRIEISARKYRDARAALTSLKGILKASDLILEGEDARDSSEAAKKLEVGSAPGVSWIWLAREGLDVSEEDLHESLRVDWSRAKARKSRWDKEVELLREEMRLGDRAMGRASRQRWGHSDITNDIRDGLTAYAAKQRALHQELYLLFRQEMGLPLEEATSSVIASMLDDEEVALQSLFA